MATIGYRYVIGCVVLTLLFTSLSCNLGKKKNVDNPVAKDSLKKEAPPSLPGADDQTDNTVSTSVEMTDVLSSLPVDWPASIPVMPGFKFINAVRSRSGGISATFKGQVPSDQVEAFYKKAMASWSLIDIPQDPQESSGMLELYFVDAGTTLGVSSGRASANGTVVLSLFYKWFTPPGRFPDGWPKEAVMPGLDPKLGEVDDSGAITVRTVGAPSLEEISIFFQSNLITGWVLKKPAGMSEIQNGRLILTFQHGEKELVLNGYRVGEKSVVMGFYGNIEPTSSEQ
jgi:hypothetical protein